MNYSQVLSAEFHVNETHVSNVINLLGEGNTIPFIARYRKEMTGALDDQVLRDMADRLDYLRNLDVRKQEVQSSITEQNKWTDELATRLAACLTLAEVEDVYRPYKQKKKTRASVAQEKGLTPLADLLQRGPDGDLAALAAPYVDAEKGVANTQEALQGASDILAERISDDADLRKALREYFAEHAVIATKVEADEDKVTTYDMYKDYSEPAKSMPSHRILAINRGEKEEVVKVDVTVDTESVLNLINRVYARQTTTGGAFLKEVVKDSYKRLLYPSLARELRTNLTERANEQAIRMFEVNLRPLLLQPPLTGKVILALDPGYRTGCKVAVINSHGDVMAKGVVYPTPPANKIAESKAALLALIAKCKVNVIAVGNGTAGKETEIFVADLIKDCPTPLSYAVVNEAGASVYSASKLGAEEFPQYDVTIRSAISLARRLQDPLAELIKIDVKSIGVGQYQHDMPEKRLTEVLEGVVEDCVNQVGVDLNTASYSLLSYVSGLNKSTAKSIVEYRAEHPFSSRAQLLKVPKLGPKAYEQSAGFLRVRNGKNVLDNTGVHPESYAAADKLLALFGYTEEDVKANRLDALSAKVAAKGEKVVADLCGVGVPTLCDIVSEIQKPGRDVRDSLPAPVLRKELLSIDDLCEGMELTGVVRNVVDFGAFVDIGVHQDGLVHISQITNRYISHPREVLKVGDNVTVRVLSVDRARGKISLTMRTDSDGQAPKQPPRKRDAAQKSPQRDNGFDPNEDPMQQLLRRFGNKK